MKNIWKKNKFLVIFITGLLSVALFYVIFDEILWMGIWCSFMGFVGLKKEKQKE